MSTRPWPVEFWVFPGTGIPQCLQAPAPELNHPCMTLDWCHLSITGWHCWFMVIWWPPAIPRPFFFRTAVFPIEWSNSLACVLVADYLCLSVTVLISSYWIPSLSFLTLVLVWQDHFELKTTSVLAAFPHMRLSAHSMFILSSTENIILSFLLWVDVQVRLFTPLPQRWHRIAEKESSCIGCS